VTRHAARVDNNHAEIRDAIRATGRYCFDCSAFGNGFPDLLCVNDYGQVVLLEVKTLRGKLTPAEIAFRDSYPGAWYLVRTAETAIDYLNMRWEN